MGLVHGLHQASVRQDISDFLESLQAFSTGRDRQDTRAEKENEIGLNQCLTSYYTYPA